MFSGKQDLKNNQSSKYADFTHLTRSGSWGGESRFSTSNAPFYERAVCGESGAEGGKRGVSELETGEGFEEVAVEDGAFVFAGCEGEYVAGELGGDDGADGNGLGLGEVEEGVVCGGVGGGCGGCFVWRCGGTSAETVPG